MSVAGQFRERVDFLRFDSSITSAGDRVGEWTVVAQNVPARIQPKRTSEILRAMRDAQAPRYAALIRYRDLEGATQLRWRGRIFKIEGDTNPDEKRINMMLDLLEITEPAKGP